MLLQPCHASQSNDLTRLIQEQLPLPAPKLQHPLSISSSQHLIHHPIPLISRTETQPRAVHPNEPLPQSREMCNSHLSPTLYKRCGHIYLDPPRPAQRLCLNASKQANPCPEAAERQDPGLLFVSFCPDCIRVGPQCHMGLAQGLMMCRWVGLGLFGAKVRMG